MVVGTAANAEADTARATNVIASERMGPSLLATHHRRGAGGVAVVGGRAGADGAALSGQADVDVLAGGGDRSAGGDGAPRRARRRRPAAARDALLVAETRHGRAARHLR